MIKNRQKTQLKEPKYRYPVVYTLKDLAGILGKSRSYVYTLCQQKKIKAFTFSRKGGWRIYLPNLKKYIDFLAVQFPERIFSYGKRMEEDIKKNEGLSFPRVYTLEETARILHIAHNFLYRLLQRGSLKGFKLGRKGGWRIPHECLEAFIEERSRK